MSHPFQTANDVRKSFIEPEDAAANALDIVVNRGKSFEPRNYLHLIELEPTMSGPRHGGARMQRHAVLRINGITHENFTEGSEHVRWATGPHYDRLLEREVARYERVLGCKCVRGKAKPTNMERKS